MKGILTAAVVLVAASSFAQPVGYGKNSTGGAGQPQCIVTTNINQCLSDGGKTSNKSIVFAAAQVNGPQNNTYVGSNVTIDGCANGQNGVTILQPNTRKNGIVIAGPASNVIVRCIRFQGGDPVPISPSVPINDIFGVDGTDGPISKLYIDRVTSIGSGDGAMDITGNVTDVTVSHSLIYATAVAQLIKYDTRARFTLYANVYTLNGERLPQIKGDMTGVDYVGNVVYKNNMTKYPNGDSATEHYVNIWSCGSGCDSAGTVHGNVIGNWMDGFRFNGTASDVFFSANTCKGFTCPTSPRSSVYQTPAEFAVAPMPFADVVNQVGSPNRSAKDTSVLAAVMTAVGGTPPPPTCPATCPAGTACTDPAKGCEVVTPTCPATCPAGTVCTDPAKGCVAVPPPVCPLTCPNGTICTDPVVGCVAIPVCPTPPPCPECPPPVVCPPVPPMKTPGDFTYESNCTEAHVTQTVQPDGSVLIVTDRGVCTTTVR